MLREEDIRRIAAKSGLSVSLTEKDYAIDWFLKGIGEAGVNIIFKGGTAIKKVYYPETWRYSHDLDFSSFLTPEGMKLKIEDVFEMIREQSGVTMDFKSFHITPGSVIANIQYIGPLKVKNRIRLDATLDEKILMKPITTIVKSKYPDVENYNVLVYPLEEILAEKIRSIIQRGKSRDYYDVWMLVRVRKFDLDKIRELIVEKCRYRNIDFSVGRIFDEDRLGEARKYWETGLRDLVKKLPDFDVVINELRSMLAEL